ncbi:MAG: galactose-1-phosphate uridylyltransferase [Deltaproteobacteria bacterium]|nr:galactose-1-phosphate uridylyltransferase [Deltaproteobacteria bacterium]
MSELRLNLVTREWVIIASERAKRPMDFMNARPERPQSPPFLSSCPFCPGNELRTPPEQFRLPADGAWKIRVVSNKYPALTDGERKRMTDGFRRAVTGVGVHEIIIENPVHNMTISSMDQRDIEEILRTYRRRFIAAHMDPRVEHVIIFKNHGEGAGTSLLHPHTQLIGTPVVPVQFRERVQSAMHFFDDTGDCLLCSILKKEMDEGVRVVNDTEHFLTFIPYAALSPFHTWIFPKRHSAAFSSITEDEITDLAFHLKTILSKFYYGLEDPDFNYVIKSSRPEDADNEYCHWYLSIVPRLSKAAGFELGSGMFINTSIPEKSAEFIRSVRVE